MVPPPPGASFQSTRSAGQGNGVKKTVSIIEFLPESFIADERIQMPRVDCPRGCGTSLGNDNVRRHLVPMRQEVGILFVDAAAGEDWPLLVVLNLLNLHTQIIP